MGESLLIKSRLLGLKAMEGSNQYVMVKGDRQKICSNLLCPPPPIATLVLASLAVATLVLARLIQS